MKMLAKVCFAVLASLLIVPLVACGGGGAPPTPPTTPPPTTGLTISGLSAEATTIIPNAQTKITCNASSPGGGTLTYTWSAPAGSFSGIKDNFAFYRAPNYTGKYSISVTVKDEKGNTASRSLDINVVANRPPAISSITPSATQVKPGDTATITCLASDPDNDQLTYAWKTSVGGGDISGTDITATWKAPDTVGTYTISVTVDDGKGGTANSSCTITVAIPALTVILSPIATESGTVSSIGDIDTTVYRVGDNASNRGLRPYFVFDISPLIGATIKEAKVTFTQRQTVNYPFYINAILFVDSVTLIGAPRPLKASDYYPSVSGEITRFDRQTPDQANIIDQLKEALKNQIPRFAVMLRYGLVGQALSNFSNSDDYIDFNTATLTITYVK